MTNPTNTYTMPSVTIPTARTGASSKARTGYAAIQERAYAKRGEQYLLIKTSPAAGTQAGLNREVRQSTTDDCCVDTQITSGYACFSDEIFCHNLATLNCGKTVI